MKTTPIDPEKIAAIREVAARREALLAEIKHCQSMLARLPVAKQLAHQHGVPLNTVRQILRGKGYAGRSMTLTVRVSQQQAQS